MDPAGPVAQRHRCPDAYLPSEDVAIAVVTTFLPEAFDDQGNYQNYSDYVWREIATIAAPNNPPPQLPPPPPPSNG